MLAKPFVSFAGVPPKPDNKTIWNGCLSNDTAAMEVKLYQLGPMLLRRYRDIFHHLYGEDRDLTIRRGLWSYVLGLLSTLAFLCCLCVDCVGSDRG